ncbi:MAG TPA: hypothetical protein VMZ91_00205 [Candidatus Paceibacterota bacterium]|nr:hypothetical protein [Candidatus Paceibacterota bacterium]
MFKLNGEETIGAINQITIEDFYRDVDSAVSILGEAIQKLQNRCYQYDKDIQELKEALATLSEETGILI